MATGEIDVPVRVPRAGRADGRALQPMADRLAPVPPRPHRGRQRDLPDRAPVRGLPRREDRLDRSGARAGRPLPVLGRQRHAEAVRPGERPVPDTHQLGPQTQDYENASATAGNADHCLHPRGRRPARARPLPAPPLRRPGLARGWDRRDDHRAADRRHLRRPRGLARRARRRRPRPTDRPRDGAADPPDPADGRHRARRRPPAVHVLGRVQPGRRPADPADRRLHLVLPGARRPGADAHPAPRRVRRGRPDGRRARARGSSASTCSRTSSRRSSSSGRSWSRPR